MILNDEIEHCTETTSKNFSYFSSNDIGDTIITT